MKPRSYFSRRTFLRSLGVGAAMLPLLSLQRRTGAAAPSYPKRLVVFSWTNGWWMPDLWPTGGATNFTLGKTLSPLNPLKDQVIILNGVGLRTQIDIDAKALGYGKDQFYGGHDAYPAMLTGVPLAKYADNLEWSGGDSVDQYIGRNIAKTYNTPFPTLTLGVRGGSDYGGTISYIGASQGVVCENDPVQLYKTLFGGRTLPPATMAKIVAERKSVLDYVGGELDTFSKRLGTDDKQKVQGHLQTIRDLENQVINAGSVSCTAPMQPAGDLTQDIAKYPLQYKAQLALMVAALKCDLTRVITMLPCQSGGDDIIFSWLGSDFTGPGDEFPVRSYHDITHRAGQDDAHTQRKILADQYFVQQVADFCTALKSVPEGTGTMLDNTVVVMANHMGYNHDSNLIPFVLIGGCGGYFKTGRYINYNISDSHKTLSHNGLMVALCNAMGVSPSGWGDPKQQTELPMLRG